MDQVIRVAIAGQGRSGFDIHARYLRNDPLFKIVAVADEIPERREQAERELGAKAFNNYQEMLAAKAPEFDLFINATPSRFHVDATLAAIRSGRCKYVITEKPSAPTVALFDQICDEAKKAGVVLYPFQNSRFYPYFTKIREIIASGVLGKIMYIHMNWGGFGRRWDWQTRQDQLAGNLFNTGPHPLDQAVVLFGDGYPTVNATFASYHWDFPGDAENLALVRLTGKDHPIIDLDISSMQAYKIGSMCNISGTCGGLTAMPDKIQWKYFDPKTAPKHEFWQPWSNNRQYCSEQLAWVENTWEYKGNTIYGAGFCEFVHLLYQNFYNVVIHGAEPEIKLEQVRRQVYILEEAHKQNPLPVKPLK